METGVLVAFFLLVILVSAANFDIFVHRFARAHRFSGLVLLLWLVAGLADMQLGLLHPAREPLGYLGFDVVLGLLGTATTLSAAHHFGTPPPAKGAPRATAATTGSGVLDAAATVRRAEMVEHAFYQLLNLAQILALHAMSWLDGAGAAGAADGTLPLDSSADLPSRVGARASVVLLVTAPWLLRGQFPVNKFSDNYSRGGGGGAGASSTVAAMYRIKKGQYLLYKHALLHALNATAAARQGVHLVVRPCFRGYWLALNTAYVMEFYLQTLVKRRRLAQAHMLLLNGLLMLASTIFALELLSTHVCLPVALASLGLNFVRRHHEMTNMCACLVLAVVLTHHGRTID